MNVRLMRRPLLRGLRGTLVASESWEDVRDCHVCGRDSDVRDVAIVEEGERRAGTLSACGACEYAFFSRRPTAAWFDEFYSHDWDAERRHGQRLRAPVPAVSRVLDFCRPHFRSGRVFEIGAGLGSSMRAFRDAGYDVSGIEPSEHRAHFVRDVMRLPCTATPIEQIPVDRTVDLVYFNHVLEHVFNPARAMSTAASLLDTGGLVYIAVPNLWNECAAQTVHYVPHVSVFTRIALERLLARFGFSVVDATLQHDIQILARKTGQVALPPASPDFWPRLTTLMIDAFGGRAGRRGVVWYPIGEHGYDRRTVSRARLSALQAGLRIESTMPARLSHRISPALLQRRVRAIDVTVSGPMTLPIVVAHPSAGFGVWVK